MSGAPGGLSDAEFKSWYAEAGGWLWGTVQGSFNEKMSVSQIVVDAVIGMIPLVGDVTAVRDLIAISMGMADSEEKRRSTLEWVTLVILLLALIPVLGGVIKGVGMLTVRAARQALKASPQAVGRILAQAAEEIIEFMNRLGVGDARKWLLGLDIMQHQGAVIRNFNDLTSGIATAIDRTLGKAGWALPDSLVARMRQISSSMKLLQQTGKEMVPQAVKELHGMLCWMQAYIRTGGSPRLALAVEGGAAHATASTAHGAGGAAPPARAPEKAEVAATAGTKPPELAKAKGPAVAGRRNTGRTKEARLREGREARTPPPRLGGHPQNTAVAATDPEKKPAWEKFYKPEPGYPDLSKKVDPETGHLTEIEAFSGRMANRALAPNEKIYRVFGEGRNTYGAKVRDTDAGGQWWGIGGPPADARAWRETCAVLDEWNGDGFIVLGTAPKRPQKPVRGVFGTVSEQAGKDIPGQYLPGGSAQAVLDIPRLTTDALTALGKRTVQDGQARKLACPETGIEFEVRPTGWAGANGVHGYAAHGRVAFDVGAIPVRTASGQTTPQTHKETHIK